MAKSIEQQIVELIQNEKVDEKIKLKKIDFLMNFIKNDVNRLYFGRSILCYAEQSCGDEIIELLKRYGCKNKYLDDDIAKKYAIMAHKICDESDKISENQVEKIKELFVKGASIDLPDKDGKTLLMKAIEKDNLDLALFLYEHGASTNIEDHSGSTPLHLAVERNNIEFIRLLKGNKFINYDIDNEHRCTPLFLAAMCNRGEMVDIMVDGGGDVNVYNFEGNTPLIFAVCHDDTKMVDKLALNGANINHKNNERCDAIYYAVSRNNKELVEKLIGYGAKVDTVYKNGETLQSVAKTDEIKKIIEQAQKVKIKGVDQIVISRDREL